MVIDDPLPVPVLLTTGEVGPLDPIVVGFDKPIDPESVGDDFVLRSLDAQGAIPLNAAYSTTDKTVTLTPRIPLTAGAHYVLELPGIKAETQAVSSKSTMMMVKGEFKPLPPVISTRKNLLESSITYNEETGEITKYWTYRYHEEGQIWRVVDTYTGPGVDGDWGVDDWDKTDDNERSGSFVTELLTGKTSIETWYESPGKIGGWKFGNDDLIKSKGLCEDSGLPDARSCIGSKGAGADGDWFTEDDEYTGFNIRRFDAATQTLLRALGNSSAAGYGPGDDGDWMTADDAIGHYERHTFDDKLRPLRLEELRKGPNDDGDWYSADDQLYYYKTYEYDDMVRLSEIRIFYRPRPNEEVFVPGSHKSFEYVGERHHYLRLIGHDPVSGDIWGYIQNDRTEDGLLLKSGVFHGQGIDQQWFTDYDLSGSLSENIVDEQGLVQQTWHYDGLGVDNLRYSGDEVVGSLTTYQYNEKGHLLSRDYYTDPGDDDTWNTPYDRKLFRSTYYQRPGAAD